MRFPGYTVHEVDMYTDILKFTCSALLVGTLQHRVLQTESVSTIISHINTNICTMKFLSEMNFNGKTMISLTLVDLHEI